MVRGEVEDHFPHKRRPIRLQRGSSIEGSRELAFPLSCTLRNQKRRRSLMPRKTRRKRKTRCKEGVEPKIEEASFHRSLIP